MSATPSHIPLPPEDAQRLDDLLADRAVFGLDDAESAELARLLAAAGLGRDDPRYDLAAARAAVALRPAEPLPRVVRERVLDDAAEHDFGATLASPADSAPSRREWPVYTMLAVAAGLMISLWLGRPIEPSLADARQSLIDAAPDLVRVAWTPQKDASLSDPAGAEAESSADYGDVVWSDQAQRGYLRFRGLRANDPAVEQYQLWVFDAQRDDRHPVDGGVFDVPAGAEEHVVEIDAKLPVGKASLFAITVEKPGGVVVSDRSRLPLLAKP